MTNKQRRLIENDIDAKRDFVRSIDDAEDLECRWASELADAMQATLDRIDELEGQVAKPADAK